ncbi:MAG: hypothetical protein HY834_19895 [Devosia nanyangense]|uniref:Sodium:solute symporter family protein n=1 Tax=Devosia nanyangense TaxID=1228055 RepID=A0A933L6Q1_9HYPH|nr:hypothetical protein [Devosia nanyangense]
MSEKLIWLSVVVALYWAFCLYVGVATAAVSRDAKSFFLADRNLPAWVFVLVATGVSFSGWIFLGHPDLIAREGFPFAEAALGAVTIALAGVFVVKRQWMLSRRYGYVTPAEMLGEYFGSELLRILVVVIALCFAVPFIGLQLSVAGSIVSQLTDGLVDPIVAMWVLSGVVFVYVAFGGMKAAAYAGALQALLLAAGIAGAGALAYWKAGGFGPFVELLGTLQASNPIGAVGSAGAPMSLFEIPGVVQFTRGLGIENPVGGAWTSAMILSYCLALMGLQLSPAFSMLVFSTRSPKAFAPQQTWAAAGVMGGLLVLFPVAQAVVVSTGAAGHPAGGVVATLIASLGATAPWFSALLTVATLAAVQGIAALYASATSTMLVRDLYRRYLHPDLDVEGQRYYARIAMAMLFVVTLLVASFAPEAQALLGGLSLGFGAQLLPVFAALLWLPWITPAGAVTGLAAGMLAVIFTDRYGIALASFFGLDLPWGRWPWTIHSAGWGLAANIASSLVISLISQRSEDRTRRRPYHDFLVSHAGLPANRHTLRPVAWAAALAWFFFAVGPGAMFGNSAFGDPRGGVNTWLLGVPSLWAWQVMWWALGVLFVWFLANRMGMSTRPAERIELLPRSQRPASVASFAGSAVARRWFWILLAAGGAAIFAKWLLA